MSETSKTPSRPHLSKQNSLKTHDPENIKVIVRLRPTLQVALQTSDRACPSPNLVSRIRAIPLYDQPVECPYTLQPDQASILAGGSWYTFDGVHPPSSSTGEIYETHLAPMIRDAVEGYNSTLFAYGATGSGKSHSMIGSEKEVGIVPRAIDEVFDLIEQDQEREYVIRVSYLEIYNEQLVDLLSIDQAPNSIPKIHEDRQGRIFVRPLVSTPCADAEDVMNLVILGESRRKIESTEWNQRSSRAHAILSLVIESRPVIGQIGFPITSDSIREVTLNTQPRQHLSTNSSSQNNDGTNENLDAEMFLGTGPGKLPITPSVARFKQLTNKPNPSPDGSIRISQLNLVDLAGSEKLTDNEARNKEAGYIKKSLLALQTVVSSLTELSSSTSSSNSNSQKHRLLHIPYRNSQLTRLLQTSLSGNAKVAFLCTISPDPDCEVETLSTLRFAAGAKKVVTKAELGQVVDRATLLQALESKVLELQAALLTNADYTEALERERDEAIERADGAAKICDDYESKLAELETLRTPLKEQHDHLRRLILTGSPHSSYANQVTIDQHALSPSTAATIGPRRRSTVKRASRLSEVAIATPNSTPGSKVSWKELLFGDSVSAAAHTKKDVAEPEIKLEGDGRSQDSQELYLTIAKLEATLAESEDTHAGEVFELRAEIEGLNTIIREMEEKEEEKIMELKRIHEEEVEELKGQISRLESRLETERIGKLKTLIELEGEEEENRRCSEITLNGEELEEDRVPTPPPMVDTSPKKKKRGRVGKSKEGKPKVGSEGERPQQVRRSMRVNSNKTVVTNENER